MNTLTVTNADGRTFTARIVPLGAVGPSRHAGKPGVLNGDDRFGPKVEIFDDTHALDPRFPDLGQFVACYYLDTLAKETWQGRGLDLHGGVPAWYLTSANVAAILAAFDKENA